MGLLQRLGPGVDITIVIMLSLPAEGARIGPGFDNKVVGFLEPFPVVMGRRIVGKALAASAADEAGNQASMGNHVDHRQLFCHAQWVVTYG